MLSDSYPDATINVALDVLVCYVKIYDFWTIIEKGTEGHKQLPMFH